MKRTLFISIILIILTVLILFCINIYGEDSSLPVVYVSSGGSDSNNGASPSSAFSTLDAAVRAVSAKGGTIVLCSEYKISGNYTEPAHTGTITITTKDAAKDYAAASSARLSVTGYYYMSGPTVFKNITLYSDSTVTLVANFNPVVFDDGFVTANKNSTPFLSLIGGHYTPAENVTVSLNPRITIKSGTLFQTVIGFSREKGAKTQTYTGTVYIDIYGGVINKLYCASVANHISGSAVVNVYGGSIANLYSGGDVTRRLNGTFTLNMHDGALTSLSINNVCKNAVVTLDGGSVTTAQISYGNDTVKALAEGSVKTLRYNSLVYTRSKAEKLGAGFDVIESYGTVYLKSGALGSGKSADSPTGSVENAFALASQGGADIAVIGRFELDTAFTEPSHSTKITIKGADENASLALKHGAAYMLGGATEFKDIKFDNGGNLSFSGNDITFGEGVSFAGGYVDIFAGGGSSDVRINIKSGTFGRIYISAKGIDEGRTASLVLSGGSVEKIYSVMDPRYSSLKGDIKLQLTGANLSLLSLSNVKGSIELSVMDGSLGECDFENCTGTKTLYYNYLALPHESAAEIIAMFDNAYGTNAVFVANGGTGNGLSAQAPLGKIADAVAALSERGGTIVVCGPLTVFSGYSLPAVKEPVTLTSLFGGIDYRNTNGAKLSLLGNMLLNSAVTFENITFEQTESSCTIYGNANNIVFGKGIECIKFADVTRYINLIGGLSVASSEKKYQTVIESGTWNSFYMSGNTGGRDTLLHEVKATINGGMFYGSVIAISPANQTGKVTLTVNDGVFYGGIYGAPDSASAYFEGVLTFVFNGGRFHGEISPAWRYDTLLKGEYYLSLNGGDFDAVTEIKGDKAYKYTSLKIELVISESIDLSGRVNGSAGFSNYLKPGADPWIIYHDGYYYLTVTAGTAISIAKSANLYDIGNAATKVVFRPAANMPYSKNLWSPEIHYYSAEDFGAENEGWYLYVACDDGNNANHRMYVLKSLSGDPMGPYGHPVTRAENVPVFVKSEDDTTVNGDWCAGQTDIRINGKIYAMWVADAYATATRRYQTINLSEMKNPWTFTGKASVICVPTYEWEKGGSGLGNDGKVYPEVVEGGTPVYAEDGSLYIVYSGSGYWTKYYQLGQLKYLGGDPLDIKNWEKKPEPIFSYSDSINGCGHASYTVDFDGNRWICYHAYTGKDTQSGRFVFLEPYTADSDGVVIGNGSTHPADISKVYTLSKNPMPLIRKFVGFGDLVPSFIAVEDKTTASGNQFSLQASDITLLDKGSYTPEEYGRLVYSYTPASGGKAASGLPTEKGEYIITVTLNGIDAYSGLSGSFKLTVAEGNGEDTTSPSASTDTGEGALTVFLFAGAAALVIGALAAFVIIKKRRQ